MSDSLDQQLQESFSSFLGSASAGRIAASAHGLIEHPSDLKIKDSFSGIRAAVQRALDARYARDPRTYGPDRSVCIIECWASGQVVYEVWAGVVSSSYRCSYSIDANGVVSLGDPVPADSAFVSEAARLRAASASARPARSVVSIAPTTTSVTSTATLVSDRVALAESGVKADGSITVKVIAPGWGSSGYYPADVLERDGPVVFPKGTQMFVDHPTIEEDISRPERSLKDLAAVLETDAEYLAFHPSGPGLYARAHVFPTFRDHLAEFAPHIGVSIRAQGRVSQGQAEGRAGPIVQELLQGLSVDFVTVAGAGGKVVEATRRSRPVLGARVGHDADAALEVAFTAFHGGDAHLGRLAAVGRSRSAW